MGEGQAEIRAAQVSDVPDVRRVARATWAVAYAGIIPEEVRHRLLDAWYSEAALTRARGASGSTFLVAEATGTVVGFAQFVRRSPELAELTRIYVLPEHQDEGIGTQLLEVGLAACRQQGMSRLRVLVERENATGRDSTGRGALPRSQSAGKRCRGTCSSWSSATARSRVSGRVRADDAGESGTREGR